MKKDTASKNWFSKHKVLAGIIIVIALVVISSALSTKSEPTVTNSSSESSTQTSEPQKTEFNINETVSFDDRELTVTQIQRNFQTGNQFSQPEAGNEFVVVSVELKNNGSSEMSFNPYDFKLQDSNGVQKSQSFVVSVENQLDSGTLAPGSKVSGNIAFEIPQDDSGLKLIYSGSLFGQTIAINL